MAIKLEGYAVGDLVHKSEHTRVYKAVRLADDRDVIVKTLSGKRPSARDVSRMKREYDLTQKLASTDQVINFFELKPHGDGNLAIVMEKHGLSLANRVAQLKTIPVTIPWCLDIAAQLVTCLGEVHRQGIVHKDIAPKNILYCENSSEVRLIDFSISSELSLERQSVDLTRHLVGSLPYMSPEQTGRMNRDLDYRTDFYSLGVTLFELLTGKLPFKATSVLEWVHAHISKPPPSARDIDPRIPNMVSRIISKLMAKDTQDRYQSTVGLLADLETCRRELVNTRTIAEFTLGNSDVSETFSIPQKLYGRENEVATLESRFEAACNGNLEMCLISGFSGVGKSALINELNKSVAKSHGNFLHGKFDQFQRSTPYSAISQAFGTLVRQLLGLPDSILLEWKEKLNQALGTNAQLIIDVVPELEAIIGTQSDPMPLPPAESQNRFQIAFQKFIRVLCGPDHPMVLFIDDLQWCDTPTLSLIQKLTTSRDIDYFLFIGAYRENEISAGHPLLLACEEIKKSRSIFEIGLTPLRRVVVCELIADTLQRDTAACEPLADILFQKSEGNPFYLNEMLKLLHEEGHFSFDVLNGGWNYDANLVAKADFGDSAVELTLSNLRKLPIEAQSALAKAACIGDRFDLDLLTVIHEKNRFETSQDLQEALYKGLILPLDEDYKFVGDEQVDLSNPNVVKSEYSNPYYKFQHDRVLQAAYGLIEDKQKKYLHLTIGKLLKAHHGEEIPDDRLIDVANHLNLGSSLIEDVDEKLELAELNLRAGIKARDSAAYQYALHNFEIGLELLPEQAWHNHYDLICPLFTEYLRCAYLTGHLDDAEQSADIILANVKTQTEQAEILSMRTRQYATIGRMDDSIKAAIEGLKKLGIDFHEDPSDEDVERERLEVSQNLGGRQIADLINAPKLDDSRRIIAIELLMEIFPAAFLSASGRLFPYLVLKSVNLSLKHGNCSQTAFAYAAYGMLLCGALGDTKTGYEYGKLAVAMNEQFDDVQLKARVIYVYGMFIHHWSNHWSSMTQWFLKGIEAGYQSGDLLYLAYSAQDCIIWDPTLDLATSTAKQSEYLKVVRDCEYQDSYDSGTLFLQMQQNFRGLTNSRYSLSDETFDEVKCLDGMRRRKFMTGVANYHIYMAEIYYLYGDYKNALKHVHEQDKLMSSAMSLPQLVRFTFISFLTYSALYPGLKKNTRKKVWQRFEGDYAQMKAWAENCADNFLHLQLAMEAELARLSDDLIQAMDLFANAARHAREQKFYRDEAMILELTGKLFLDKGYSSAAAGYLQSSMKGFDRWGAHEKCAQLRETYPAFLHIEEAANTASWTVTQTSSGTYDQSLIDLESVMKASHAISGEVVLSRLWDTTMDILLENAGAQTGYFLQTKQDGLHLVAASGDTNEDIASDMDKPLNEQTKHPVLPFSIIHYCIRTGKYVVLDNASTSEEFATDPYFKRNSTKSLLCIPITRSGDFQGVVYLENNLTIGAFSEAGVEVVRLLAAQAAISFENAQLYNNLETNVEERTHELSQKTHSLERLSNRLSKYLSPQVYRTIFDSEQLTSLVSQRKRLTVFFSDLVGFTETADRLESEELTDLLNHYLTEMSDIALKHGATIDKFVGDAILVFFGDPETLGLKEDALMCLKMAIAMRKRMEYLKQHWHSIGIERPLQCRIGINTGYCTVGNFGSEDRMDYTIIGGNVNIAARLESASPPGEILISYETWALIKDEIACEEMGHMNVKGVSHPIATYRVLDLYENLKDSGRSLVAERDHLKLDLDISKMSAEERKEAEMLLRDVAKKLQSYGTEESDEKS